MNTEIMLPVPELKQALSGLNKLVGRKTTLPVLSCVKVSRQENGVVTLQATDLDAHATFTLGNAQLGQVVDVLVPIEQLNKAIKCSTDAKLDLALVCEGKSTKLRYFLGGNPVQQAVNTVALAEWPACPEIKVDSTPLQPGFGEAMKQAMQCCSQDSSRYVLRGACLDARDPKAHYVVSTNGRFLFSANSFTFQFKDTIIVPDSKFINGAGLLDIEPCFLAIQPVPVKKAVERKPTAKATLPEPPPTNYICLHNKQWQFVTREIEGQFPNWKQCVPTVNGSWTLVQLRAPAIEQLLKVIPNLPGNDGIHNTIRLRTNDKVLWVEGRNKDDKEWTSIAISDVTITGKAKEIALDRNYLLPALKFGLSELAIENELTPMVCSSAGKRIIIMPVNLKGPQPPKPAPAPEPVQPQPATTSVATPARTEVQTTAEERKTEMARTPNTTATTETTATADSPFKLAMQQMDQLRESMKNVLRSLAGVVDTLKVAEKEKKATDKEVEQFREKLREIQGIKI